MPADRKWLLTLPDGSNRAYVFAALGLPIAASVLLFGGLEIFSFACAVGGALAGLEGGLRLGGSGRPGRGCALIVLTAVELLAWAALFVAIAIGEAVGDMLPHA